MNRLFFGNFDFEEQLQGNRNRSAKLERLVAELSFVWLAVCDENDRIWCPVPVEDAFFRQLREALDPYLHAARRGGIESIFISDSSQIPTGMELVPWGWSPAAVEFGVRHRLKVDHPPLDLVKRANSREFSVPRDQPPYDDWDFAELLSTLGQVIARVERVPRSLQWVIKANWSHAARERIIGRGPQLSNSDIAWVKQRLSRDGVVCWERWLPRRGELGVQWNITRDGRVDLVAVTELLVDERGQYAGTLVHWAHEHSSCCSSPDRKKSGQPFPDPDPLAQTAVAATRPVIEELQQLGYFGPVGIDCMRFYDDESRCDRLRPLQDLNVRWTMGRLAAEWSRQLSGRDLLWWHGARELAPEWTHPLEWIATSPALLNGQPFSHPTHLALSSGEPTPNP